MSEKNVTGHMYVDATPIIGVDIGVEAGIPIYGTKGEVLEDATRCPECSEIAVRWNSKWAVVVCHYCGERP